MRAGVRPSARAAHAVDEGFAEGDNTSETVGQTGFASAKKRGAGDGLIWVGDVFRVTTLSAYEGGCCGARLASAFWAKSKGSRSPRDRAWKWTASDCYRDYMRYHFW